MTFMMKSWVSRSLVVVGLWAGFAVGSVKADDNEAQELLFQAQDIFAARADLSVLDKGIETLDKALATAQDPALKYDILILASRFYYWKANTVEGPEENNDAKVPVFSLAMEKAAQARKILPDFADAYYYFGISLGRWGLARGVLVALDRRKELEAAMVAAKSRLTRQGQPGETIDSYGPNRTMGRAKRVLPPLFGRDMDESKRLLKEAYEKGSENALNHVYYAETLAEYGRQGKQQAREVLDRLLAQDPEQFNIDRVPETKLEMAMARKVRDEL